MQLIKRESEIIIQGGDRNKLPVEAVMMMMSSSNSSSSRGRERETAYEKVKRLASGNAVVVFSLSECCMCHVVKRLLFGLGVGPTIIELDEQEEVEEEEKKGGSGGGGGGGGREMLAVLYQLLITTSGGGAVQLHHHHHQMAVPAVFVGGKFLGGLQTVMSCHINGTLVPLLKNAGALWL